MLPNPSAQGETQRAAQRLIELYEQLTPAHLERLHVYYASDAHFKDPFNEVRGVAAITQIFEHMFASLDRPRFVIHERLIQNDSAFLTWEFQFRMRRFRPQVDQCIRGATFVKFDTQGRVVLHRDYWDAAEELYEKFPVLGSLLRWVRKSASPAHKKTRP